MGKQNPDKFRLEHRLVICHVQTKLHNEDVRRSNSFARSVKVKCGRFVKLFVVQWVWLWDVGFSWQRLIMWRLVFSLMCNEIIIIFLYGLGRLTCSGIDALSSFPGASTFSSSPRFVVEGVFRQSGVVRSFKVVDPVLFVFESHVLYSGDL